MRKRHGKSMDRQITEWVNSLTSEQMIRLYDIADPNPPTEGERKAFDALSEDELLAELLK